MQEAITVQSKDALERAFRMQKLREEYRHKLQDKFQTSSFTKLIDELFMNPYISITKVKKVLGVTYPTAG